MGIKELYTIDFDNFHFLREKWLWLFVPMLLIFLLLLLSIREKQKWRAMISPSLQPYMFSKGSLWSFVLPSLLYFIGTTLIIVSLAGPTWKKIEVPGAKIEAVVLIALDVSHSMMAEDVQPNRLERAKFKITDLLNANPRARAGLLAVAGTTHPVLPVTSDYNLVKHHAQSLQSWIMPVQGRNLSIAMSVVDSMLKAVDAPSTVLLMTDEIQADEIPLLRNFVSNTPHNVEVLVMATPAGAKVPGYRKGTVQRDEHGNEVFSKPDPNVWTALKSEPKITVNFLTVDKSDVEQIVTRIRENLVYQKQTEVSEKEWQDMGILFLLPVVLIALFWFRKGWVIQWCWIPVIMLTSCSVDSKEADWWYTSDYQGQLLYEQGRFEEAAEKFQDLSHKAAAAYRAGDYETAAELFALDSSATGKYNQALTLAKLGRYEEAGKLFDEALGLDPDFAQAKAGLEKTQQIIHQLDSVTRFGEQKAVTKTKDKAAPKKKEPTPEDDDSAETETKKKPKPGESEEEVATNIRRARESDKPDTTAQKPGDDAQRILLQKVNADPAEFLRRRFELQKNKYYKNVKEGAMKW
jgi:Ca-activated chloride channel family protein